MIANKSNKIIAFLERSGKKKAGQWNDKKEEKIWNSKEDSMQLLYNNNDSINTLANHNTVHA